MRLYTVKYTTLEGGQQVTRTVIFAAKGLREVIDELGNLVDSVQYISRGSSAVSVIR